MRRDDQYRKAASTVHGLAGLVEVDRQAPIRRVEGGAYVVARIFVYDDQADDAARKVR